ncbi:444_t:CDS:2, partial [Racocetra persica]
DRHWIKTSFQLRELETETNPITQIITVTKNGNGSELTRTICPFNRLYDILCKIHVGVLKHVGASKMWDVASFYLFNLATNGFIGKQYNYIPQSFIREFCGACKTCATRQLFPNSLAAKPIVASKFLSRVQVDLIGLTFQPINGYNPIQHFSILEDLNNQNIVDEEELPDNFFEDTNNVSTESLSSTELSSSSLPELSSSIPFEPSSPIPIESLSPIPIEPSSIIPIESLSSIPLEPSSPITIDLSSPIPYELSSPILLEPSLPIPINSSSPIPFELSLSILFESSLNSFELLPNRNHVDRHTLPCKVIEELPDKMYRLQCKNGILDVAFNANELMPLGPTKYEELEICENKVISVREAARMQSMSTITGVQLDQKLPLKKSGEQFVERSHK